MKSQIVSKAEFARRLGVSPAAVSKAVKYGRISVRADGKIDYASALAQWRANTDPEKTWVKPAADDGAEEDTEANEATVVSDEALTKIKALLSEQGVAVDGPLTIQLARTAEVISRTEERQFRLAIKRGEYLPKGKVYAHFGRISVEIKKAFLNLPSRHAPIIAGELGVDEFKLEQALKKAIDATLNELAEPIAKAGEQ
jgi:hypothetical protein